MWGNSDLDPGGQSKDTVSSTQELNDLKDQNEQQLLLITQLKDMLKKEQSSVTQEKVEEYVNTLNKLKAKRSKQKKDGSSSTDKASTSSSANIDANKKERINLLRQQLEENKARLAERGKSQKGIEEMVTQLQAQFKDSESRMNSASLNLPLQESKNLDYNENTAQKDLFNILLTKERKLTELLTKNQKLEGTVMDLQENLKEKDSVIDARTKAITLMTDSLSKKGKNTLDALEETKDQMRKMQEHFVSLESDMKNRQLTLLNDLKLKNFEISDLKETINQLTNQKVEYEARLADTDRATSIQSTENSELLLLKSSFHDLQEENTRLLEKINYLEASAITSHTEQTSEERIGEITNNYLIQISELEEKLKEAEKIQKQLKEEDFHKFDNKLDEEYSRICEENKKLLEEKNKNIEQIEELQKKLEETQYDLNLLKNTGLAGSHLSETENAEINKLKKQLDESNKNMIKMRATQKGKVKELNKKLNQFKNMNDANSLIVQLQNEVSKLNEKIAELEDEKGSMQLKMVESTTSSKGDTNELEAQIKELNDKLLEKTDELIEKTKVVEILETDILSLKADLKLKHEEQIKVSTHVSSEMSLIQFEEQIEKLESDNKNLREKLEEYKLSTQDLLEKYEIIKREKQDLTTKLDNYVQENIELLDKLEKLSAEKVSSVESIEIVEGLTQQEKIELAAYQKHVNPEETGKFREDESSEPPVELNESVLQLSEDTAELLQKIEMFTQERKEVMQKMDYLRNENELLHLKVKEIENNKDILEETYEQLQNEKDDLISENQKLLRNIEIASNANNTKEGASAEISDLELQELQERCKILTIENQEMIVKIDESKHLLKEKQELESKLSKALEENGHIQQKILWYEEEIDTFKSIVNDNKNELMSSADKVNNLQNVCDDRKRNIEELNENIEYLHNIINDLQGKNNDYEQMESELQNLNITLTEQLAHTAEYQKDILTNNDIIENLNKELANLHNKILEYENDLEIKDNEIKELKNSIINKDETMKSLQNAITEKDNKFKILHEELKQKYIALQQQLENSDNSLEKQLNELSGKNKEQLEKMKKLAANLKKKTQAFQELEERYINEIKEWEIRLNNVTQMSEEKITSLTKQIKDLENQLQVKSEENVVIQNEICTLKRDIETLKQTNTNQHNSVNLQQELSESLHEDINIVSNTIPDEKLRELEMLLETKDIDISNYQERIEKFEENISVLQNDKYNLELKNNELAEKLSSISNSCNETILLENKLSEQLQEITIINNSLSTKLEDAERKLEETLIKNTENEELIKKLKVKLKKAHERVTELKVFQANVQELENLNENLRHQISTLESHQKQIQIENESLQQRNNSDYEKIETDYQSQLNELLTAKNDLLIENEKLSEKIKDFLSNEQDLTSELDQCKFKLVECEQNYNKIINQLETELRNSRENISLSEAENKNMKQTLDESRNELKNSLIEIENLNKSLSELKNQLTCIEEEKAKMVSEKTDLSKKLCDANETVSTSISEIANQLESLYEEHSTLRSENDKLKENIQVLEFAKFSLEASCESAIKDTIDNTTQITDTPQQLILEQIDVKKIKQSQSIEHSFNRPEPNDPQPFLASNFFNQIPQIENVFDNLNVTHAQGYDNDGIHLEGPSTTEAIQTLSNMENIEKDTENRHSPVIENNSEALFKKIKALEFLLYNVDKEKEIALEQCIEMTKELAQIIIQKMDLKEQNVDGPQIISDDDVAIVKRDLQALKKSELNPETSHVGEHILPIQEEQVVPKKTNSCLDQESREHKKEGNELGNVESQILSTDDIKDISNSKKLQKLEFQEVDSNVGQQQQPVVEPLAQPKHAYLCYTKDDKPQSLEAFEENDDGWGWGPEESKLDEEYINTMENIPQIKKLLSEIQQLKEQIKVLHLERENHLEEIKQLQIKSGKLIKKCKELKAKNEQTGTTKKQTDVGFFDLNETIQEELKSQIQQLEKKIQEVGRELEKEKSEKNSLVKRVDILTSANEKMVEMKEIQDSELFRWQRKHKEVLEKLQEFEWSEGGFDNERELQIKEQQPIIENSESSGKIKELENTIKELSLDNEELQALLEEQTTQRIEAEKEKANAIDYKNLADAVQGLEKELNEMRLKHSDVSKELYDVQKQNETLKEKIDILLKSLQDKDDEIGKLEKSISTAQTNDYRTEFDNLKTEISNLRCQLDNQIVVIKERDDIIVNLQNTLEEYNLNKSELDKIILDQNNELLLKTEEIESLKTNQRVNPDISNLELQINELNDLVQKKEEAVINLNISFNTIKSENDVLQEKVAELNEQLNLRIEELNKLREDKEEVLYTLQSKINETENIQKYVSTLEKSLSQSQLPEYKETEKPKTEKSDEAQKLIEQKLLDDVSLKTKTIEDLSAELKGKNDEIHILQKELENKQKQFEEQINIITNELNENWQLQVEQRGNDVAESWKMHLDMIEKEYESVQENYKLNISELEEKCNILTNENVQLKNNLHHDSIVSKAVNNQDEVASLSLIIDENKKHIEELENKLSDFYLVQNELESTKREVIEKDAKINSINIIIETTQKQFDEKREVVEEVVSLLERNALSPISYEKQDILLEFQRQLNLNSEKDVEINRLNEAVTTLENNLSRLSGEKDREITGLNQVIEDLEKELSIIHIKESEIVKLSTQLHTLQNEKEQLQTQINVLQTDSDGKLQEFDKLWQEQTNFQVAIDNYKEKIGDLENTCSSLRMEIDEKNRIINDLNRQLLQIQTDAKNDNNKQIEMLTGDIIRAKEECNSLQKTAFERESQINDLSQQLAEKTRDLEVTQQNMQFYQSHQSVHEEEMNKLKLLLQQREQEYNNSLEMLKNNQLADIQRHYDELLSNKDIDNQMLYAQVQELLNANKEYNERLSEELSAKQDLEGKLSEQTQLVDEDTKQLEELKLIIEDQETRITQLKKDLYDKSNQYDSLIAEMDLSRQPVTQQPSSSSVIQNPLTSTDKPHYDDDDLTEPVSRAELDLALYMLHQRDVRCEELTVELTQLLEERDTLQLKLSNSIREKEELRQILAGHNSTGAEDQSDSIQINDSYAGSSNIPGANLANEALHKNTHLASKLSELRNIGYKKDKTFVDEQSIRRLQQLAIMEQHINEASKLPPEAAAKLVDASYTLSRDVQSPSKVLLNWLWGKNPPKANDS